MSGILQTILMWWSPFPSKKFDLENGDVEQPPAAATSSGSRRNQEFLAPPRQQTGVISYTKEVAVPLCPAISDDARRTSSALRYDDTDESADAIAKRMAQHERVDDKRDCTIKLADLITLENFYSDKHTVEPSRWRTKFDNGRAVVVEIAIKVTDERWNPHQNYLRVQVSDMPALQQNTIVIGDREAILAHCLALRLTTIPLADNCQLKGVSGWCYNCNSGPNMFTVYQMPLVNNDLFKYAQEIVSCTGTHGHIVDAPGLSNDNDKVADTRLEVSPSSTLAQDLWQKDKAVYQEDPRNKGVVFVSQSDWNAELKQATQSVLVNVPFADLKRAKIRIAARGDNPSSQQTLQVRIAVQCLGVYE